MGGDAWGVTSVKSRSGPMAFLTADTGDFNALGVWKHPPACLLSTDDCERRSLVANRRQNPGQRTGVNLWLWATRVAIGCMWFQGTLWKLPFGRHNGLDYCTEQTAGAPHSRFTESPRPTSSCRTSSCECGRPPHRTGFVTALILGFVRTLAGVAGGVVHCQPLARHYNQRPAIPPNRRGAMSS